MRVAMRTGMRKAKVALARKLAVVLHRMLADNQPFDFARARGGRLSKEALRVRAAFGTSRPEQVPSPGRWIRRGRKMPVAPPSDHAQLDRQACSSPTPSGGGRAPTPDRSAIPAAGPRLK